MPVTTAFQKEFHADSVRNFMNEFPNRRSKVEALIREGRIVIIDEKEGSNR
jgi:hypothetical protein